MKRILPILMLVLALPFAAGAQSAAPAAEELTRLLNEFLDGASRNDVKAHERFWADDLIYTRSAGVRMGKAEILENARSGPTATAEEPTTYTGEDVRIQQYGDTAVVAFRLVGTTGSGDKAVVTQYLNTGTFVKRKGEWRAVAWQSTRMPEAEPQRLEPKKEAAVNLTPGAVARPGLYEEILEGGRRVLPGVLRHLRRRDRATLHRGRLRDVPRQGRPRQHLGRGVRERDAGEMQAPGRGHGFPLDAEARCLKR